MADIGRRQNPHRLYRDRERAIVAGVCAGLSEYSGFNLRAVRAITVISLILFLPFTAFSYAALALFLPVRPADMKFDDVQAKFWRGVSNAPSDVFSTLKHRFRELDKRVQTMEAFVTSKEFEIDRELHRHQASDD